MINQVEVLQRVVPAAIDSPYANNFTKLIANYLSSIGCEIPVVDGFLRSGGGGILPCFALVDDVNQFFTSFSGSCKTSSLNGGLILTGVLSEIAFDCFEILDSLAGTLENPVLQDTTQRVASYAMSVKIIGGVVLAGSSVAQTSSLLGVSNFLEASSFSDKDKTLIKKINSILRTGEVTAAAVSNVALFIGGESSPVYTTASLVSNVLKGMRFVSECVK